MEIAILAAFGGCIYFFMVAFSQGDDANQKLWRAFAEKHGFILDSKVVTGELDEGAFKLDIHVEGAGKKRTTYTRMVINSRGKIYHDLSIKRETLGTRVGKKISGEDVLTHDKKFDDAIHIRGQVLHVAAMMSQEVRALVLRFVLHRGVTLRNGEVVWLGGGKVSEERLEEMLEVLREIAQSAQITPTLYPARLRAIVETDQALGVRRNALSFMASRLSQKNADVRAAFQIALEDSEPELRLIAAKQLGVGGNKTLEALVQDREVEDKIRAEALALVINDLSTEHGAALLKVCLETGEPLLLGAAFQAIERSTIRGLGPRLVAFIDGASGRDASVVAGAIRALGCVGAPDVEATLVRLLEHKNTDVQLVTMQALAQLGSIAAVEPLMAMSSGLTRPTLVKQVARGAIVKIQSRSAHAGAGHLSLAENNTMGRLGLIEPDE